MESPNDLTEVDEPAVELIATAAGYDLWADFYDCDGNPLVLLEEELLPSYLGDVAGLDIADIGSGTGRNAIALAKAGARVVGLDFSEGMLAKARAKTGPESVT